MANGLRLIIATTQRDLINEIKNSFKNKMSVEFIVSVSRPSEVESVLNRNGVNVLIWDLDETQPNTAWAKSMQGRYAFYIIYTALSSGKSALIQQSNNDTFLQKPAVFTPLTTSRYIASVSQFLESTTKCVKPTNMRELVKMVGIGDKQKIIAIGSSTGGTNALEDLLRKLPADIPPVVVVQHMPSGFTKLFADRLNALYPQEIREAQSGDFLMHGRMLIAPADRHMKIIRQQGKLAVDCFVGTRIHGVMPAADILFESVAQVVGSHAVGVILTGMGNDGAKGLLKMKHVGCKNIGQDEATCVVYGMPKAAKELGALEREYPLSQIPEVMMRLCRT